MQLKEKYFILPTFVKKTKTKQIEISLHVEEMSGKLSFFKILVNLIQIVHMLIIFPITTKERHL